MKSIGMLKKFVIILVVALAGFAMNVSAESPCMKFDPQRYDAELEKCIVEEAKLTQKEAAAFLPLFREMRTKLRGYYKVLRDNQRKKFETDEEAAAALKAMDNAEIQMKKLQQQYHARFLKVLGAKKVIDCLRAEDRFNHRMMDQAVRRKVEKAAKQ